MTTNPTMRLFESYMIVYTKSNERQEIFNNIKKNNIPNLNKFEAIDTINEWEYWKTKSINDNLTTQTYINKIGNLYGKLGCNLSHQLLIKNIYENHPEINWLMILEDDITLTNYDENKMNKIISIANENNSHFIQLFVNRQFKIHQSRAEIVNQDLNLYKMISQWGTVSYLINRFGMNEVINSTPIDTNMDFLYNSLIYILFLRSMNFF